MRKLKLSPESLRVESFEAPSSADGRGTVRARESENTYGDERTCGSTCFDSGMVECDITLCNPSCVYHNC